MKLANEINLGELSRGSVNPVYANDYVQFSVWKNDIQKNVIVSGSYKLTYTVDEYDFVGWRFGPYISCDGIWSKCDGKFTTVMCMLRPNCEKYFRKLTKYDKYFDFPGSDVDQIILYKYFKSFFNACQKYEYIGPINTDRITINQRKFYSYSNVYEYAVLQQILLDENNYGYHQIWYYRNEYRINITLGKNYISNRWSEYHVVGITTLTSKIVTTDQWTCKESYFGSHCSLHCVNTTRHSCTNNVYEEDGIKTFSICKKGWIKIPTMYVFMLPVCQNALSKVSNFDLYRVCLYLDPCNISTPCKGWNSHCLISANGTYQCVTPVLKFSSNMYPNISNISYTRVLDSETITCSLVNLTNEILNISRCLWRLTTETTKHTPEYKDRNNKNAILKIHGNKIMFLSGPKMFGYDFLVLVVIKMAYNYLTIIRKVNYTLLSLPNEAFVNESFYITMMNRYMYGFSGFPQNEISFIVQLNEFVLYKDISLRQFFVPTSIFLNVIIKISACLYTAPTVNYRFTTFKRHSIRSFNSFGWDDKGQVIFFKGDTLKCYMNVYMPFSSYLALLYGPNLIHNYVGLSISMKSFLPGEYIISCVIKIEPIKRNFIRIKKFSLYSLPTMLCFLPFGMIRGMLVKCTSDMYPRRLGTYNMRLVEKVYNKILTFSADRTIRIPHFRVKEAASYLIICTHNYVRADKNINITHEKRIEIRFRDTHRIHQQNTYSECYRFSVIPQEYQFESGLNQEMIFFRQDFYLTNYFSMNNQGFLIIVFWFMLFLIPNIPIELLVRRPNEREENKSLLDICKYLTMRYRIRNMNETALQTRRDKNMLSLVIDPELQTLLMKKFTSSSSHYL